MDGSVLGAGTRVRGGGATPCNRGGASNASEWKEVKAHAAPSVNSKGGFTRGVKANKSPSQFTHILSPIGSMGRLENTLNNQ